MIRGVGSAALLVAFLMAPLPSQAHVYETHCHTTIAPKDPRLGYFAIIYSDSQAIFLVQTIDRLYLDKVISVDPGYPVVIVRARASNNATLVAHFISPEFRATKDLPYPTESVTTVNADGTTVTDQCGDGE